MSLSPTDQPTNTYTTSDYVSVRLTLGHGSFAIIKDRVLHDCQYVAYPHLGKDGTNPHWHIFIPVAGRDPAKTVELYRNRVKRGLNITGNGRLSLKYYRGDGQRTLTNAITYGSHEHTEPEVSNEELRALIAAAPAWVDHGPELSGQTLLPFTEEDPKKVRDWQLTYSNLVPQAIKHAQTHRLTYGLKATVEHMMENTKWKPCNQMRKCGVHPSYEDEFEVRTSKKAKYDMSWWIPKERS